MYVVLLVSATVNSFTANTDVTIIRATRTDDSGLNLMANGRYPCSDPLYGAYLIWLVSTAYHTRTRGRYHHHTS